MLYNLTSWKIPELMKMFLILLLVMAIYIFIYIYIYIGTWDRHNRDRNPIFSGRTTIWMGVLDHHRSSFGEYRWGSPFGNKTSQIS